MVARQKLIEAMIDNNLRQLKFESARGGAEIERACALRDMRTGRRRRQGARAARGEIDRSIEASSRRSTGAWSPNANGSTSRCWSSTTGAASAEVADHEAGGEQRSRRRQLDMLSEEDRSKDEFFVKLAQVAEAMIAAHGKDFAMGALILTARFIAEGRPLTKPENTVSDRMNAATLADPPGRSDPIAGSSRERRASVERAVKAAWATRLFEPPDI